MLIRLSVDEVMWCRQQSVNHQGQGLLCNLHCATTVVLREQLNFRSAVIRSERSSCLFVNELPTESLSRGLMSNSAAVSHTDFGCKRLLLQCDYSNRASWSKVDQSKIYLRTKDSIFFSNKPMALKNTNNRS